MKLGKDTGSLINHLMANSPQFIPVVGMGGTILKWTDRDACTVIEVSKSGKTIKVQVDTAKRLDSNGMSEIQEYEYSRNPDGEIQVFRFRNGKWKSDGRGLLLGERRKYYDFSF